MNKDLINAIELFNALDCTCVLCRGDTVITDTRRGIRPLLDLLDSEQALRGFCAADKVVGKAAAMLYCLLGVESVHACVISRPARDVLVQHGISVTFGVLADAISNRDGTGFYPMERAVWDLTDPVDAPGAIRQTMANLTGCIRSETE